MCVYVFGVYMCVASQTSLRMCVQLTVCLSTCVHARKKGINLSLAQGPVHACVCWGACVFFLRGREWAFEGELRLLEVIMRTNVELYHYQDAYNKLSEHDK